MVVHLTATMLATLITDPSARGIATQLGDHIQSRRVEAGAQLPSIRSMANALQVGPTTIATAWRHLQDRRLIRIEPRSATYVCEEDITMPGRRVRRIVQVSHQRHLLDLCQPAPDQALLPDLHAAMTETLRDKRVLASARQRDPVLMKQLISRWPFHPAQLLPTLGARDGFDRVSRAVVRPHDRVIVESSCDPALLDVIERLAAVPVPVVCDEEGPRPEAVCAALASRPVMMLVQPRMGNPLNYQLTEERLHELHRVLSGHDCIVVEVDRSHPIASTPALSLGLLLPDRTVHVRSWNNSYGPELHLGAIGGAREIVSRVQAQQHLTGAQPSAIAQRALSQMLEDRQVQDGIERAAATYRQRRRDLTTALERAGLPSPAGVDGWSVWISTPSATHALEVLAELGIGAAPGWPFTTNGPSAPQHISISTTAAHTQQNQIAGALRDLASRITNRADH